MLDRNNWIHITVQIICIKNTWNYNCLEMSIFSYFK